LTVRDKLIANLPVFMASVNTENSSSYLIELFGGLSILNDVQYRISHNGKIMPLLPIDNFIAP
jgi:hypothetical protein